MSELLLLATLVTAIAIGWFLGRRSRNSKKKQLHSQSTQLNKDYFTGLSYLLNDQQDQAIETFMRVLEINPETIDTHIAMGNLFRSKGETEKAIRLHQNLFARPTLSKALTQQVQLELARDFQAAGLLDRAERLLLELSDAVSPDIQQQSQLLLIKIYEQEKEWQQAIAISDSRLLKERPQHRTAVAHYYCEQAEQLIEKGEYGQAKKLLKQALYNDPQCIRANWTSAEIEFKNNSNRKARSILLRIPEQDPRFYSMVLPKVAPLLNQKELHKLLDTAIEAYPSRTAIGLKMKLLSEELGIQTAIEFLEQLIDRKKLRAPFLAARSLEQIAAQLTPGVLKHRLETLEELLNRHETTNHASRCMQCGFKSGLSELWQCPRCRSWGTIRPDDAVS